MNLLKSFGTFSLLLVLAAGTADGADSNLNSQKLGEQGSGNSALAPSKAKMLKASISHSVKLSPLSEGFRAGAQFDFNELKRSVNGNEWYQIPSWAAGRWKQTTSTTFFRKDLRTGSSNFTPNTHRFVLSGEHGLQRDRLGNIWDMIGPGANKGEGDEYWVIQIIDRVEPIFIDQKEMVLKYTGKSIRVSKSTRRIRVAEQLECITTSTSQSSTLLKDVSDIKSFDEDGEPIYLVKCLSFDKKESNFSPVDVQRGIDVHRRFIEYLKSNNLSALIP